MTTLDVPDTPKMIRETLCFAQALVGHSGDYRAQEHVIRLQQLINECDRHRPLGRDGAHGDRHTESCGCEPEDARSIAEAERLAAELADVRAALREQIRVSIVLNQERGEARQEIERLRSAAETIDQAQQASRDEANRLRGLLCDVVQLDTDGYLLGGSPLLAQLRREAGRADVTTNQPINTTAEPRLGWPWCGDTPTGSEIRSDVTATIRGDGTITLTWDRDDATCTIVGRGVLDALTEERNRLVLQVVEADQRAALLRRQVEDAAADREEDTAQIAQLLDEQKRSRAEALRMHEEAGRLRAEVERLRGLVGEVLDRMWADWPCPNPDDPEGCYCPGDGDCIATEIERIRREAGL